MLLSHTNAIERVLIAQSAAAHSAGHPNLRGGPREWFIREFLESHLPTSLEIGQGEIIDEDSQPSPPKGSYRPQVDIVIYRQDLPRITYSRDNIAFLAEGVIATIESKSVLTKKDLKSACQTATVHKSLKRTPPLHSFGDSPQSILSYVVAFGGPKKMSTVARWLPDIANEMQASHDILIDMIVVLGKGVLWQRGVLASIPGFELPRGTRWAYQEQSERNLFMMFMHMLTWVSWISAPPSTVGYASRVYFEPYKTVK
jgi:hypothetical protein